MARRWSGTWMLTCSKWIALPRSSLDRSNCCGMDGALMGEGQVHTRSAFPWFESYQAASASLYDQVWMTGWRFTSSIPAIMRSLSSCFEVTRMWRRTDRANLEKKPSMRLSHEPCLGVKVNSKRPGGRASSQAVVSLDMCAE